MRGQRAREQVAATPPRDDRGNSRGPGAAPVNFRSDNVSGVAPEVLLALGRANEGNASAYGTDTVSAAMVGTLSRLFEHELSVFPVATGTAANALGIAHLVPPHGAVLCHQRAHINDDECGAPEFYSGGAKLIALNGPHGKIDVPTLRDAVARYQSSSVHNTPVYAISISQPTELGVCYQLEELLAIGAFARSQGLALHMDGARLANAVAHLDLAVADMTSKIGVDVLSFGLTKCGGLAAEAVVLFAPDRAAELRHRQKRGGHLCSKVRFLAAQFEVLIQDGLWLRLSRHANAMAARLARGIAELSQYRIPHPVEANLVFVRLPCPEALGQLRARGVDVACLSGDTELPVVRFACSFQTRSEEVDRLIEICSKIG